MADTEAPEVTTEDAPEDVPPHRADLIDAEGNGGVAIDGVINGTAIIEDPDRPDVTPPVGMLWLQQLPGEA